MVLAIHLLFEGYRIQLLFLYGFTILILLLSLAGVIIKPQGVRTASRTLKVLGRMCIAIGLIVTAGILYVFPVFDLPAPTGESKVGTQAFHFVDSSREETFGQTPTGKRELMVQVWYPAESSTGRRAPLIPDTRILSDMAENYGLPGFTFQHLKHVSSHSYVGAEVSTALSSYPLIIANPGFDSSRFLLTSQAEDLASHGYIVAAIDHTYNTFATEFPDGRIATSASKDLFSPDNDYETEIGNRDKLGQVLTDDVAFVMDQLELVQSGQIPSQLQGKINLGHIGVFGHSIGGATAYDAAYDPRIAVGINLDGGLYRLRGREALQKPFLFMNSETEFERLLRVKENRDYTDEELERMGNTREWEDHVSVDKKIELERMRKAVAAGGQLLYIEHSEHLNYTDAQFISPIFEWLGVTGEIAPARANAVINAYMLDFFDQYLKNQGGALMEGPDSRYPEAKFATSLL